MFGINHVVVGAAIAERWNFPDLIKNVIRYHHTIQYPENKDIKSKNICNIVKIADQISLKLGIGFKKSIIRFFPLQFERSRSKGYKENQK